ncbi:sensor histidine kinase [Ktedonobacter racemifer]|nr:sensor histidine kinase [Ktedonobacter racemifer]
MNSINQTSPLRWFLLLWVGLVYIQVVQTALPIQNLYPDKIPQGMVNNPQFNLALFTLLMILHAGLHWGAFSLRKNRDLLLSFLGQGILVLLIYFLAQAGDAIVGLCLALTIEAITLFRQARLTILVGGGCLLLFGLTEGTQIVSILGHGSGSVNKLIDAVTGSTTLILFVIACVLLSIQQGRAHQRDQTFLCELEIAHAELKTAHEQLEEYAVEVEDLTLIAERQRLARELHDTLAQGLVGLTMQLETIDALLLKQQINQARTIVQQAMTRARATITEARAAIEDLRAETQDAQSFSQAVQVEIQRFTSATGISCACSLPEILLLPPALQEHLLRLVTEGLMNIARHAQATRAWVCANCDQQGLTFEIGDDGIGFDPEAAVRQAGHYGLLGLRERARLLQGQLQIISALGKGTTICLHLLGTDGGIRDEQ